MPYVILRFQKCKVGSISVRCAHNERTKESYKSNPDIDATRKPENYHLVQPAQTYLREARRMIKTAGCKTRSNSTVMVETLITASPEFMNTLPPSERREYFQKAFAFMESRIGRDNIVSAVVHNDEKTPHMHLSFCPITPDRKLSAKYILGNQAQLSRWQTEFHTVMSSRWPELERGKSSIETGRKHIPPSLFKQAEQLGKQIAAVEAAINDIGIVGNAKKREVAVKVLHEWLPRAQYFTAQVNKVNGHIKSLEQKERDAQERIARAEERGERSADRTVTQLQAQMAEIKQLLCEERERSEQLRRQCRNQETLICKIPLKQREKLMASMKPQKERAQGK